jgi:hypothetical protein
MVRRSAKLLLSILFSVLALDESASQRPAWAMVTTSSTSVVSAKTVGHGSTQYLILYGAGGNPQAKGSVSLMHPISKRYI